MNLDEVEKLVSLRRIPRMIVYFLLIVRQQYPVMSNYQLYPIDYRVMIDFVNNHYQIYFVMEIQAKYDVKQKENQSNLRRNQTPKRHIEINDNMQ